MVGNIKCMQKKNNRSLTLKAFSFIQFYYFTSILLVTHTFSINPFSFGAFLFKWWRLFCVDPRLSFVE